MRNFVKFFSNDNLPIKLFVDFVECTGYMSPEYAVEGKISEKCDVFSFGILLLEIVSGKSNSHVFEHESDSLDLLRYVSTIS